MKYQREQKRRKFRRRAAIEPIIGHLKSDHRLSRNYLKGFIGDEINLLMTATAWNLKKWMNNFIRILFVVKIVILIQAVQQLKPAERHRYSDLLLILWKLW